MAKTDDDGFSVLSRAFKRNSTLENYVALRRANPNETIEVAISGGLDWLYDSEAALKDFDISPSLVASVLDADDLAISELCLLLMEQLIARDKAKKTGKTHLVSRGEVISDRFVNELINVMLDSLDWNNSLTLPRDLIVLIRHQTGGGTLDWKREVERKELRSKATMEAIGIAASGKEPSYRAIGKAMGVNATTVMRLLPDKQAIDEIYMLCKSSAED